MLFKRRNCGGYWVVLRGNKGQVPEGGPYSDHVNQCKKFFSKPSLSQIVFILYNSQYVGTNQDLW